MQALRILKDVVDSDGAALRAAQRGGAVVAVVRLLDLQPPAALLSPVLEVIWSGCSPPRLGSLVGAGLWWCGVVCIALHCMSAHAHTGGGGGDLPPPLPRAHRR